MTIAGSLANALSGLAAQARAADLVSANVANATTEGYGRRELELAPVYLGVGASGGVAVAGLRREVDMVTVQSRRLADAAVGHETTLSDFYDRLEQVLGTPDQDGSLSAAVDALDAALIEAASRPDNETRLSAVLSAAQGIANRLNTTSDTVQELRSDADRAIAQQVDNLNNGLIQVRDLNYRIKEAVSGGQDPSTLMDLRQQAIDTLTAIVPIKQVTRDHGTVALYTPGGALLLDGRAAMLGFASAGTIVSEMTLEGGALAGLTLNDAPIRTNGDGGLIAGGSLQALFEIRDELAVTAQGRLDGLARDLIERFEDPSVDPTLAAGDPGLFTDGAGPLNLAQETGLAGRISVNSTLDPAQGGALWRLRDGLGAAGPGDVGEAGLIQALSGALSTARTPASGGFLGTARSASGLAADLVSLTHGEHRQTETTLSYSSARADALKTQELSQGVDTDQELQKLMLIEQAYTANARVIQTVGGLLDMLMEL